MRLLLSILIIGVAGCVFSQDVPALPEYDRSLPEPARNKQLYQNVLPRPLVLFGIGQKKVRWPTPKTKAELELWKDQIAAELEMAELKARQEETAKFRRNCRYACLVWLFLIPVFAFLAFKFSSRSAAAACVICILMIPLTFTFGHYVPVAAPWLAGGSVLLVLAGATAAGVIALRKYRRETTALHETIDFTQSLKQAVTHPSPDGVAPGFIKALARDKQSPDTQLRVKEHKLIGG